MEGVELVAVVDVVAERAAEAAADSGARILTDYRELIGKADAVSIAAPTTAHGEIGNVLLDAGLDVLVEKPMTSSIPEARALIETAERRGRILQVGHVERFNPVVRVALEEATTP